MKPSFRNYFKPTPKNVQKWLIAVKGLLGSIAVSQFVSGDATIAFWVMVAGAAMNELANLIGDENA